MKTAISIGILLIMVCLVNASLDVFENRPETPHLLQRQREILLASGNVDTRQSSQFHEDEKYTNFLERGQHEEDDIVHLYMVHFKTPYAMQHLTELQADFPSVSISEKDYVPMNTFLMEATETLAHQVREHEHVAWVD